MKNPTTLHLQCRVVELPQYILNHDRMQSEICITSVIERNQYKG
jgi:hypothetical protein